MIPWKYNGEVFVPPEEFTPEIWYGFVYMIYSLRPEGKKYVGKKFFDSVFMLITDDDQSLFEFQRNAWKSMV